MAMASSDSCHSCDGCESRSARFLLQGARGRALGRCQVAAGKASAALRWPIELRTLEGYGSIGWSLFHVVPGLWSIGPPCFKVEHVELVVIRRERGDFAIPMREKSGSNIVECGLTCRVWLLHSDALPLEVHIAEDLPMVNRIHQNVLEKLEIPGPLLQAQVRGSRR